jgi:hypothetical protein
MTTQINTIKFRMKLNGDVIISRFGYPNDRANYPRWYFSSTAKGKQAQELVNKYELSLDNRETIE